MITFLTTLCLLALAATVSGQQDIQGSLPVDVTIAFLRSSNSCDVSTAPSIHVYGFQNTSEVCIEVDLLANASLVNNGTSRAEMNYTTTNIPQASNVSYTGIWYQQLSGNTTRDQAKNTVGTVVLGTYPCPGCSTRCSDEQGSSIGGGASILPVGSNEWLQWSCNADGACYNLGYTLRSFSLRTAIDRFYNLTTDEQNNRCELAAVTSSDYALNNNTNIQPGTNSGVTLSHSMSGLLWMAACSLLALLFWL